VEKARSDVSYVFQQATLLPWRNLLHNVALGLELRGVGKKQRLDEAEEYLDLVGLGGLGRRYPDELSGGMQQRVSIARALCTKPGALLMDEPFGALDEQTRLAMGEELLSIWDRSKTTIVFVTHSIQEAILLADQIFVMSSSPGKISTRLDVSLPRPRSITSLATDEGHRLQDEIWTVLRRQKRGRSAASALGSTDLEAKASA
jgi:NitT/TauT family transport system ATP-binding protein